MRLIVPNPPSVQLKLSAWDYDVDNVFSVIGAGPYWKEEREVLVQGVSREYINWTSRTYEIIMIQSDDSVVVNSGARDPYDMELDMLGFFATIRLIPSCLIERNASTRIRHFNYSLNWFLSDSTHPLSMESVLAHRKAMRTIDEELSI